MCGRFSLGVDTDRLVAEFGLEHVATGHRPRFNIAPTQPVPAVVGGPDGLRLGALRWGLVPGWADDPGRGSRLINARAETVARRPAFRDAFRTRRCWVLADGFYEWKRAADGSSTPYYFRLRDGRPFAFAGLWDRWTGAEDGDEVLSCAILTTAPNDAVSPIHDRMPVILPADRRGRWLETDASPAELRALMRPFDGVLDAYPVSPLVNSPANDAPEVRFPLTPPSPDG